MSLATFYRWHDGTLHPFDYCDLTETIVEVADSWLVSDGDAFALELHRTRFLDGVARHGSLSLDAQGFWDAAVSAIPRQGDWFPRVELRSRGGAPVLVFRLRPAPQRMRSLTVATHGGEDPRTAPAVKGPDLDAMLRLRTGAQRRGADEAVIVTPLGFVVEGTSTAFVWWRGPVLCAPPAQFERVESVTAKSVLAMAAALGVELREEAATPAELDGLEVWALNALHGIRMVTDWIDGPGLAEEPGRLQIWRSRLDALRQPLEGRAE